MLRQNLARIIRDAELVRTINDDDVRACRQEFLGDAVRIVLRKRRGLLVESVLIVEIDAPRLARPAQIRARGAKSVIARRPDSRPPPS